MKVHCINILLFALPLNILINDQRNHYSTPCHTETNRSLCECELYAPANYDNDPQMKEVMENFDRQASQRLREYEERMQNKRMQCKDKCDKEIQKIILKDKLEKQMAQQLTTLETKIDTDDIPTCICEKSVADKVEKGCLRCGEILGTAVPELGAIGGTVVYAAAIKSSVDWGIKIGMQTGISDLKEFYGLLRLIDSTVIEKFVTRTNYFKEMTYVSFVQDVNKSKCVGEFITKQPFCNFVRSNGVSKLVERGASIAEEAQFMGAQAASEKFAEMTTVNTIFSDPIVISSIAVVTIAVILLIIYLILRYRRKKKMKKKLQNIKLLNQ
ncbi:rifin PIR protein,putative [Plasmodium sp. DRC-Itaito]|nr:rifin PIR protein,putative [Plasmodium sp. DRC-Itaito]SPJ13171.1 rifin PIR protein,putative [Plasmodium sp. DRC-Itaito]